MKIVEKEFMSVLLGSDINTYSILDSASLVLTESSVAEIEKLFKA